MLQVLFVAVLFGYAMTHLGKEGDIVHQVITTSSHVFFRMMNALMKLAPLGAGGAMAFTIGRYGVEALKPLALLMGSFYLTCLLFVLVVLGTSRRSPASASCASSSTSRTSCSPCSAPRRRNPRWCR